MEYYKDDFHWNPKAKVPLRIVIVGAGIAGLVAAIALRRSGHHVVVLEQSRELSEIGAGIQIAPNASRILGRLGLLSKVVEKANMLVNISLRRYADNQELGTAPLMPQVGKEYGAPCFVIHRADLQRILLESAIREKIEIRMRTKVTQTDPHFEARVKLDSGEWVNGDVLIAADGIKSTIRRQMAKRLKAEDQSIPTGDAAYRVVIPKERLEHDPRAKQLLDGDSGVRWMGPEGHIMAYPIQNNTLYNMVLLHPSKPGLENEESWTKTGNKKEMLDFYSDWNCLIHDLLSYAPEKEVMEWTLNSHSPLPSWVENKVVLVGDSCHPMLPYVAQGAAQAIEDAATLAVCFSLTPHVPLALDIYNQVRKPRGEAIQQSASTTRTALHLPDGPQQKTRDAAMARAAQGEKNPDLWADKAWQRFMWGTDVMKETLAVWEKRRGGEENGAVG